jgi:hypothetical protein
MGENPGARFGHTTEPMDENTTLDCKESGAAPMRISSHGLRTERLLPLAIHGRIAICKVSASAELMPSCQGGWAVPNSHFSHPQLMSDHKKSILRNNQPQIANLIPKEMASNRMATSQ